MPHEHTLGQVTISSEVWASLHAVEDKVGEAYWEIRDLLDNTFTMPGDPLVTATGIGLRKAAEIMEKHLAEHIEAR